MNVKLGEDINSICDQSSSEVPERENSGLKR